MNFIRELWDKKLNKIVYFLFYMALCFPFVGGGVTNTDTQPWALFWGIALVLGRCIRTREWERNVYIDVLTVYLLISVLIGLYSVTTGLGVMSLARSGANYASVFFITIAVYQMLKVQHGLKENWIKLAILIWFVVGLIQRFVDKSFAYGLLSLPRTSADRGVVSLSGEPSFYGYMCIFFLLFAIEFKRHRLIYMACLLFEIVFLAMSTLTILYLVIFVGFYILEDIAKRRPFGLAVIALGVMALFGGYLAMRNYTSDNRLLKMLKAFYYDPGTILDDDSLNQRFADIKMALTSVLEQWGLPHGFYQTRIMSGYGAALYETGIFAVMIIVLFAVLFAEGEHAFTVAASMTVIMFSAIQLACPMLSFYLGCCLYKKYLRMTAAASCGKEGILYEERNTN
jgi:hypothetical protein